MELTKQVTSLEISKRLKELGVKQESLFLWVEHYYNEGNKVTRESPEVVYVDECDHGEYGGDHDEIASAFTVTELGELLPNQYDKRQEGTWFVSTKNLANEWECGYANSNGFVNGHATGKTEAEARGKILVWLLENNLI